MGKILAGFLILEGLFLVFWGGLGIANIFLSNWPLLVTLPGVIFITGGVLAIMGAGLIIKDGDF